MTEIAPSSHRGALVALVDVAINLGIVAGYCVAYVIDVDKVGRDWAIAPWRVSMGASVLPPALFMLCFPWLPESPRWLASKRRDSEALAAVDRLRRAKASDDDVAAAAAALSLGRRGGDDAGASDDDEASDGSWLAAATSEEGRYASLLGVAQQATGTEAILYFAPTVTPGAGRSEGTSFDGT